MALYVSVRGFVRVAIVEGRTVYEHIPASTNSRRGMTRYGSRIARARRVERQIVPKSVVVAWLTAALMTSRDDGAGTDNL